MVVKPAIPITVPTIVYWVNNNSAVFDIRFDMNSLSIPNA